MRVAKPMEKNFCFIHYRFKEDAIAAIQSLSQRGTLGQTVRLNFGKHFDYTEDELSAPYDAARERMRLERGADGGDRYDDRKRPRDDDRGGERADRNTPTHILWVGNLTPAISTEEIRENFQGFGNIINLSRPEGKNFAFVHYETVDQCAHAIDVMRGSSLHGVNLVLNFGKDLRPGGAPAAGGDRPHERDDEEQTNTICMRQFSSEATQDDFERLLEPFEGFINVKVLQDKGLAFAHFDTVANTARCRYAIARQPLRGVPMRVSFGKTMHTLLERQGGGGGGGGGNSSGGGAGHGGGFQSFGTIDQLEQQQQKFGSGDAFGALTAAPQYNQQQADPSFALATLPAMSGAVTMAAGIAAKHFTRDRPVPTINVEAKVTSLLATPYASCGEVDRNLRPTSMQQLVDMVDDCIDSGSSAKLASFATQFTPLNFAHISAVAAKRLHEQFNDDPHKKLLVFYAITQAMLGVKSTHLLFTKPSIESYFLLAAVTAEGQEDGTLSTIIKDILESVITNFLSRQKNFEPFFVDGFRTVVEEINARAAVERDLAAMMSKRRRVER